MKRFIVFLLVIFSSFSVFAQSKDIVTEHYKVSGNCDKCKKRIENAAYIKGVKRADWDKNTGELTVVYRHSQTNATTILQHIAKAGHESEVAKADDAAYKNLPHCCAYKQTGKH